MKKLGILSLLTLALILPLTTNNFVTTEVNAVSQSIDFDSSKWIDYGDHKLWSIDASSSTLNFCTDSSDWSQDYDKVFTGNLFLTEQFDTRDAMVTLQATFQSSVSSQNIIDNNGEVHLGLVPWYKDSNNWAICYAKFSRCDDPAVKDGHIFDFVFFVKIDGSTFVDYYVKDDPNGNRWVSSTDSDCSEWHSAWPDRINGDKVPSSLQETLVEPSDEVTILLRKTRKTYANRDCDSFYVKINDYELNFGLDNFMFSGLKEKEDEDTTFTPQIGFYLFGSKKTSVKNISVDISHEKVLPLPTIEPLTSPTKSGVVNKKIKIPEFTAIDNTGSVIDYSIALKDPDGEDVVMDGEDYFVPTKVGTYVLNVSATDEKGYTGEYSYNIKVKDGTNHVDSDVYDDILTFEPKDTAITAAYVIFISVPSIIVLYICVKLFFYFKKKKKGT